MKKLFFRAARIAMILLTGVMFLSGCKEESSIRIPQINVPSVQSSDTGTSKKDGDAAAEGKAGRGNAADMNSDSPVCDRWVEKGSVDVREPNGYSYEEPINFTIPLIQAQTTGARAINDEIARLYEDTCEKIKSALEADYITFDEYCAIEPLRDTAYEYFLCDDVLSLLIYRYNEYSEVKEDFNCFYYDCAKGEQLTEKDILTMKNTNKEWFIDDIRRAAMYESDRDMTNGDWNLKVTDISNGTDIWEPDDLDKRTQMDYAISLRYRAQTISIDNINENIPVILDEDGELKSYVTIYCGVQYGAYMAKLSPVDAQQLRGFFEDSHDIQVYPVDLAVCFNVQDTEWNRRFFEGTGIQFDKEYILGRNRKNCVDVAVSLPGNGLAPYIVLLSDDGTVGCVNLTMSVATDCFEVAEMLYGLKDIQSLETEENKVVAIDADGRKINVDSLLYNMMMMDAESFEMTMLQLDTFERYVCPCTPAENGSQYPSEIAIEKEEGFWPVIVNRTAQTTNGPCTEMNEEQFYNVIHYRGMNENGLVYDYRYLPADDKTYYGTMALRYGLGEVNGRDNLGGLIYTHLGGFDIADSDGKEIFFEAFIGDEW